MPNEREKAEANLALLVRDAGQAKTQQQRQAAVAALENFSENTLFGNLGMVAEAAIAVTAAQTRQSAIDRARARLDDIRQLSDAFKTAAKVAEDAEANLFFPRLATSLGQVEMLLESLTDQLNGVRDQINELKDGVDLAKLKGLAESVGNAADTLKEDLDGL